MNWLMASSMLDSRFELLLWLLVALAISATSTVRISPVREARRSAVMPRSMPPAGQREPPPSASAEVAAHENTTQAAAVFASNDWRPPVKELRTAVIGLEA